MYAKKTKISDSLWNSLTATSKIFVIFNFKMNLLFIKTSSYLSGNEASNWLTSQTNHFI